MLKDVKKGILKGSILTSSGQGISVLLLFLSTAIVARFVTPQELGTFFIIISISALIEMLISLGFEPALIKFSSLADNSEKHNIFNKFLSLRILTQILFSLLYLSLFLIIKDIIKDWYDFKYFLLVIFNLSSLRNFFNADLQSSKEFKLLALVQITQTFSKVIAYLTLGLSHNLDIYNLLLIEIFSIGLGFLVQLKNLMSKKIFNFNFNIKDLREIITFSFPLYLNSFLQVFVSRVNNFLILFLVNIQNVANYEISKKIPDGFYRLSSSLTLVYYPYVSDLLSDNKIKESEFLLNRYLKLLVIVSMPIFAIFYLFRNEIVIIVFSSKYVDTSFAVFLFMIVFIFNFSSSLMGYTLVASGAPKYSFIVNSMKTGISLMLSIPLIYFFGFIGAIYSLMIANIVSFLINKYYLRRVKLKLYLKDIFSPFVFLIIFICFVSFIDLIVTRSIAISIFIGIIFLIIYTYLENEFKQKFLSAVHLIRKRVKFLNE